MGDRTSLWIVIHKGELAAAKETCGVAEFEEVKERGTFCHIQEHSANWGGDALYQGLRAARIPFRAGWDAGASYGPGLMSCNGFRMVDIATNRDFNPVVAVDRAGRAISSYERAGIRRYFALQDRVDRMLALPEPEYMVAKERLRRSYEANESRRIRAADRPGAPCDGVLGAVRNIRAAPKRRAAGG